MKAILAVLALLSMTAAALAQSPAPPPISLPVMARGLVGDFYRPADAQGRLPAVIVLGGSEGGMAASVAREARRLARDGYATLHLGYFGMPGLPETLQLIPLEYFKAAIDWLRARPDVDPGHIGIEGTSIGGEVALVVAAQYPEIKAVVAAVPSSVIWQGISDFPARPASTFTLGGRPLPNLPFGWTGGLHDVYARYNLGLKALAGHDGAVIPVERINGPVMVICGKADSLWPSCPMSHQVVTRLRAKGFSHPIQLLEYARAGHAVFGPPIASTRLSYPDLGLFGGSPVDNDAARQDDWPKSVAFLDAALKPQGIR